MDDIVKQALAKWPNVPDCYGWLGLDARGHWYLRDDAVQAAGAFPHSKGTLLQHDKLLAFIARNYEHDDQGQWFFQNGPQRVYVELESAPWIWRLRCTEHGLRLSSHTGQELAAEQVQHVLLDEQGRLFLVLPQGLGMVHSLDMLDAANALEEGVLPEVQEVDSASLPLRFGFVPSPQAHQV